ncbi:MAG: ABC transporter substrate-binding protein [Chitinophagaceae bacterium]|nr:ABC transporter substrate-binding protein [Chitinophagaceae bacterium]
MPLYKDQMGRAIELVNAPQRIVSLVPSLTELLAHLGLADRVKGITKFCVHPDDWFRNKARIGGTKTIDIPKVLSLSPDLIIASKEENVKEQIDQLAATAPVWVTDVNNLEEACAMISDIGGITASRDKADRLVSDIKDRFGALEQLVKLHGPPLTCAYLIWKDPYMTVGADTFISDMLLRCGLINAFAASKRYPEITLSDIKNLGCQLVLLSSEPYPFREQQAQLIQNELPGSKVILVDGEMFSWYGSRLLAAPSYFKQLLYP